MYFVDESDVTLYTFAQNNTESRDGMQMSIEALPSSNPDAERYVIYVKPQLKVHNRRKAVGLLSNLTE
ncbi:hypothetical protein Nos7524_3199 [Nostoc sp. PCC 7524]|nr:hypothetical protein Nos7524_3199 [Nostoc sp. PCC 7524]